MSQWHEDIVEPDFRHIPGYHEKDGEDNEFWKAKEERTNEMSRKAISEEREKQRLAHNYLEDCKRREEELRKADEARRSSKNHKRF